ncbi:MAG: DUF1269 domain-containing protein [Nocardioidaceae bacterium]
MAKIVAFSVPSLADGDKALDELDVAVDVKDVALVYKDDRGRVKVRQTSDVTAGKGAVRGALLGTAVGLFAGPVVGVAAGGAAGGGALAALGDRGVDNKLMKLAGEQLEAGHGAVFVMAEDAKADALAARIRRLSNLKQYDGEITVGDFPADAQKLVKEQIEADNAA